MNISDRITLEPGKRGGRPCIRGLRISVYDILAMLADGWRKLKFSRIFLNSNPPTYAPVWPTQPKGNKA